MSKDEKEIENRKNGLELDKPLTYGQKHKIFKERYRDASTNSEKISVIAELLGLE